MSTDIFREIDDDLRRQKLEQLWQRHGRSFILAIFVLIALTAGYVYWQGRTTNALEASTGKLTTILQQIKADNRATSMEQLAAFASSSPAGQAVIAQLYKASIASEDGKTAEAVAALTAIAADNNVAPLYRDYARLLSVYQQLDSGDPVELQNTLSPLKGAGKPWRFAAEELSALLSLKQGDRDSATAALERIQADTDAPAGGRERATRILATLNTDS
jgi:hypothetical protein